jgi:hypothetical protein
VTGPNKKGARKGPFLKECVRGPDQKWYRNVSDAVIGGRT